jgi:hypothetical protein
MTLGLCDGPSLLTCTRVDTPQPKCTGAVDFVHQSLKHSISIIFGTTSGSEVDGPGVGCGRGGPHSIPPLALLALKLQLCWGMHEGRSLRASMRWTHQHIAHTC